jgi:hypothetical protein
MNIRCPPEILMEISFEDSLASLSLYVSLKGLIPFFIVVNFRCFVIKF